jgi:hypothetical protein
MPETAVTPTPPEPAYGARGNYIYFDDDLLVWVREVTIEGRKYIALDTDTGPVTQDGRWIRIDTSW